MKKVFFLVAAGLVLSSPFAQAVDRNLGVAVKSDGSTGIRFSIPYSAGIHKGASSQVQGAVIVDQNDSLRNAHFTVPIQSLTTGNTTRDCHMREALGIKYQGSQFPAQHVCDANNQVPSTGPDSITFPQIIFDFVSFEKAPTTPLAPNIANDTLVKATIQIHGQTINLDQLPISILKQMNGDKASYRVTTQFKLSRKDFGIEVKPFKFGPVNIGVDDLITVNLDLMLSEGI